MYKLIISPRRYDAILHASHLLDNRSVIITLSNGMEEPNIQELCLEARKTQKRFEVEKAYKVFDVRQLYCFEQYYDGIDYQFVLMKLQLMTAVTPFTHLCYRQLEDRMLMEIFGKVKGVENRIVYTDDSEGSLVYKLSDEEIERKLDAIQRMPTVRRQLLYKQDLNLEYLKRIV